MSQRLFHLLELRQVELAHLTLIGKRQYLVQSPGSLAALFQRSIYIFDDLLIQHAIEIADPNATTVQPLQQLFERTRSKHAFNRCFQFRELRFFLNLDDRLLESHRHSRPIRILEPETGIEPATNSLEGCDSPTELLPQDPAVSSQLSAKPNRLKLRSCRLLIAISQRPQAIR